jgi:hypothetical protein
MSIGEDQHPGDGPAPGSTQQQRVRWTSPLVLAVLAATAALSGNAWVSYENGRAQLALDQTRASALLSLQASGAEATLIVDALITADQRTTVRNARLLLAAGLVEDDGRRAALEAYVNANDAGNSPSLLSIPHADIPDDANKADGAWANASDARIIQIQQKVPAGENGNVVPFPGSNTTGIESFGDPRLGAWANSEVPAKFGRFTSGLKIGDAVKDRGATGGSGTWLADVGLGGPGRSWDYMARARVTSLSTNSLIGGTFAARTIGTANGNPIGLVATALADSPNARGGWGIYSETLVGPKSKAGATGVEFNTVNMSSLGDAGDILPYGTGTRGMSVLNLAAGGDRSVHGETQTISAFTTYRGNGATAKAGIVFKSNALERLGKADTSFGRAMTFPQAYGLSWYGGGDQAEVLRLYSSISKASQAQAMTFSDDGVRLVRGLGESTAFYVPFVPDSTNFVQLSPSAGGQPVEVAARGNEANIDLVLSAKGTGVIDFGSGVESGTMKPTHRAIVKFDGVPYYIALDPA